MRAFCFFCTVVAKLVATAIVLVALISLLVAYQMIPYTAKVGNLLGVHYTPIQAAVFYIGCILLLLYTGVSGLVRWRLPAP